MTDQFGWLPERTVRYKTYIKTAIVEGLQDVFINHVDELLRKTRVTIDYPKTELDYPTIVVRFFEREIRNAGVGHEQLLTVRDTEGVEGMFKFRRYFYTGDIEFAVYALSSLDRDLLSDSVVQTIAMGKMEEYTQRFLGRIYIDSDYDPTAANHFINVNTDSISGFGESQGPTPWDSEDDLVYTTSYRTKVFGEFVSLPPELPIGYVEAVKIWPYIGGYEEVPEGTYPDDLTEWVP